MRKSKQLLALIMAFVLLVSVFPFTASAATDLPPMISVKSDWQGTIMGDVGGQDKIVVNNFGITEDNGIVTMKSTGDRGKIQGSDSGAIEGIAYYYKGIPANTNFELTAKVNVDKWTANGQVAFGIMLRSNILTNTHQAAYTGDYIALGAWEQKMEAFYKQGAVKIPTKIQFDKSIAPAAGNVYDLSLKRSGNAYLLKIGNQTQVIDDFTGTIAYAGLFTARNTTVTYSNVKLTTDTRTPSSLKLNTTSFKNDYFVGDNMDLADLQVTAVYADQHEETLTTNDYMVTGFNNNKTGAQTVTIHFNGKTATVNVNVKPLVVTALELQYLPAKMVYYLGDLYDPQGLSVIGEYNNGASKEELSSTQFTTSIAGATVSGSTYKLDSAGSKTVTIRSSVTTATYTTFDVIVKPALITGLEIRQNPQKTVYYIGESFVADGMTVYATYSDNSVVKLMRNEYTLSALDSTSAGPKQVWLTHKTAQPIPINVTVKQKELVGIQVTQYPKTTYTVGQNFDKTGLVVSSVFDNTYKETLAASQYTVDASAFNSAAAGSYDIRIVPVNTGIAPIILPTTVRAVTEYPWKSTEFGQSSSAANNKVTVKEDGTIQLVALEGGGKVTGDHDGITYYYTELDANQDNFSLSADVKVVAYAKEPYDGQESFGIMARDVIGTPGDSSVFASNIAAIGGYSGGTTKANGTQLFVRTGVTSPDGAGSLGVQNTMLKAERPSVSNTYPAADYKLTLAKTNSGFTGKLNAGNEEIFFVPDILKAQDPNKMYVGFYAARLATIEVSNKQLTVTAAQTDAPKVEAPKAAVTPSLDVVSLTRTSKTAYALGIKANVKGTITVKQGQSVITLDQAISADKVLTVNTTLNANSSTGFSIAFIPDDTQLLTSYNKMVKNFTVEMKTYADDGDIYVSPTGTSKGTGTPNSPLDLDTAIDFVKAGQKIIVQDGRYIRSTKLDIKKGNDGAADAKKYLVAAAGARPIIDFDKKSEGVVLSGNYWQVQGIDFTRTAGNTKGFTVGGNYNLVDNCKFYDNGDTGLQISSTDGSSDKTTWPSYNLILNSESYDNIDPSNNNADGFAAKLTAGVGNVFRGDIAHNNIDDGWDLYTKAGSGAIGAVIIEDSIAYNNGTLTNGTVGAGDKNGFKLGGEGIHVPHIIQNSLAFGNGAYGFASNSNPGVRAEGGNIAYNNAKGNMNFTTYSGITTDFRINGFMSYQKGITAKDSYPANLASDSNYMFNGSVSANKSGTALSDANFVSLQPSLPYQRNADGTIIRGDFLKFKLLAPTGLIAVSGKTEATLTWNRAANATSYTIKRSMDNVTFVQMGTTTELTYVDSGLLPGKNYYYTVSAVNDTQSASSASVAVYTIPGNSRSSSTGGSGGGAGSDSSSAAAQTIVNGSEIRVTPQQVTVNGKAAAQVTIDSVVWGKAIDALTSSNPKVTVEVTGSELVKIVQVTASSIAAAVSKAPDAFLSIKASGITYDLPLKVLDINGLALSLGVDVKDLKLNISVEKVSGAVADAIAAYSTKNSMTSLAGAVDFTITAEANGKTATVSDFGTVYVSRSFEISNSVDTKKATGVLYNPVTGTMTFVPTLFTSNGSSFMATIKRPGNSIYTVVQANKTFADLNGHWAQADIELLASKLLIKGTTDTTFVPQKSITRAEFAALLVRAAGLNEEQAALAEQAAAKFSDVQATDWYAGAVGAASKAGLVDGLENGSFQPNATITREQMAVMIARAIQLSGKKYDTDAKKLAAFDDSLTISAWAKDAAAGALNAGIVNGTTVRTFAPDSKATRAEAAVMLKRFLLFAEFMNE
ncbi:S-layer homology domain-containing protein [Paenibacillus sp. FSL H7-0331]|uniref:S-layer homology domain-containing protein n=1 Tax=Paenibacillus sp. FSL H7-0331 TaxID=1920421 RepID=UPI00096C93E0|nr:S-layer homology domain-containing protein [Paenibacillus sp. FSL H7-0331]OMF13986.1 hypothetical protein BK127_18765 [Paenibacillus sp. FSL H7-0331]